jgi:hypothetical protein
MPRNGSGVYSLPSGINPVVTQTLITSNWANTTMTDIANALTGSVSRDGQAPMTGNLNMANFQVTNLGTPTAAGSAVSLSYVQNGTQFRLTNVSGVNALTATLAGAATSFTLGQLVELIPASSNTGPVTLNVNGAGVVPVLSGLGKQLGPTSLIAGNIYLLAWNGTGWNILTSPNATAFAQAATSGWDRPSGGTYPPVTKFNANTVAVPAGSGRIVAPSTRDISGVTEVSWVAQNVALTNIPNAWATTLAVDATGTIQQLVGIIQGQWARQYIILATVAHIDGQIDGIVNQPAIYGDAAYESVDLGVLFHNTITAGGQVVPSANTLHMDVLAGRMWLPGGNANNANQPNFVDFANQVGITIYPSTATNVVAAATQAVPVTQYDPAGAGVVTSIPVPLTQAVIHRLFYLAGQYILCYGQTLYPDLPTAIQSINNDNATFKPPGKLVGATLFAYLCATGNCTNLNDGIGGRIVGANAVSATSGGGAGVSEAPLDGNCYARLNGAWWRSIFIDPNYNGMLGNNAKADGISLSLNAAAATNRQLNFQSSGVNRFSYIVDNTAEPGANAGANLSLNCYADNGAFIISPYTIARATGFLTFPPGLVTIGTNTLAASTQLSLNAAAGQGRFVGCQTGGVLRWILGGGSAPETGNNAGSDFVINRYSDTGVFLNQPFSIARATGNLLYSGAVTISVPVSGAALSLTNTNANGAQIVIRGDGATTPSKIVRVRAGNLEVVNDANSVIIGTITDNGGLVMAAGITSGGTLQASGILQSSTSTCILAATGAGAVYLRPNGSGSATGQLFVNSGGQVNCNGNVVANTSASLNSITVNDSGGNGANINLNCGTGTYPNKYLRSASNAFQLVTQGYAAVVASFADYGTVCGFTLTGGFYPGADNSWPIGQASTRWTAIYAVNGAIQTSDAREKTTVKPLTDAELKASKQLAELIGTYQWLESIKEKGADKARQHFGMTAQAAIAVMEANGLDPFAYGFLCYDEWDEIKNDHVPETKDEDGNITQEEKPHIIPAGNRYSMRYDELAVFIARGEHERLKAIEALLNI